MHEESPTPLNPSDPRRRRVVRDGLRRYWLSLLVAAVGLGYTLAEPALLGDPARGAILVADVATRLGLTIVLALGAALFARPGDGLALRISDDERQLRRLMAVSTEPITVIQGGRVVWGNAAIARMMGAGRLRALIGLDALSMIHPDDRADQAANLAGVTEAGRLETTEARIVRPDGVVLDVEIAAVAVRFGGKPAVQLAIRDVSARRAGERALEASDRQLRALLDNMSLLAISVGPDGVIRFANRATYRFLGRVPGTLTGTPAFDLAAFPGSTDVKEALNAALTRRAVPSTADLTVQLDDGSRRSIRWNLAMSGNDDDPCVIAIGEDVTEAVDTSDRLQRLLATTPVGICAVDAGGAVRFAEGGPFVRRTADVALAVATAATVDDLPDALAGPLRGAIAGRQSEELIQLDGRTYEATFSPADDQVGAGAVGVFVEVTQRRNLEREGIRLATAIDQAMDAVVITDASGAITYVNPAFERVSGYTRSEVLGGTPRILKSGSQSGAFYATLWRTITAGNAWSGELINRRKDGAIFREVATVTPVRDGDGAIVNFVAVKRDVTRERQLEDALDREVRERAAIVTALERIGSTGDPVAIGTAVCEEVIRLPGFGMAAVFVFDDRDARTLAYVGPPEVPVTVGRALPPSRTEYLRSRAALGPWAERWSVRDVDGPYGERMAQAGVEAIAYIPLRDETGVFGVLGLGTFSRTEGGDLFDRLPALGALGTVASSHLSLAVRQTIAADSAHRDVESLIQTRSFHPVFQPIVDLRTGEALGFEALTRFDGGTRPDIQFERAVGVGLGIELEVVTLAEAVAAARQLPAGAFLSLNVSPGLTLRGSTLADILAAADRPVVLEITEHAVVDDYAALRSVVRSLPVPARLAVDDAGAGFASLRHVLELAPDIVKVDRSIVAGIDHDPARQALLAGLRHFASRRGIQLIAEGIETAPELSTLTSLAVPLGQGFLLGRPVAAADVTGDPIRIPPAEDALVARRSSPAATGSRHPDTARRTRDVRAPAPAKPPGPR